MIQPTENGERMELNTPIKLPYASGFLWNKNMMISVNCRGYATAQFMQPEPAKYAHAPNLEAKTFMQPEQPFYAHHPGRFFYIKDEATGSLFSAPYEPVRAKLDKYEFSVGKSDILWTVEKDGVEVQMRLSLAPQDPLELWQLSVRNVSDQPKKLSIYPYFPVGYMSWMNQSGEYHPNLDGVVCSCITPYQKYKEYDKIKTLKDKTFFIADTTPKAWEVNQRAFEGEGGLHAPSAITEQKTLSNGDARYETPAATLQYRIGLVPQASKDFRFIFGPAKTEAAIAAIRDRYFSNKNVFQKATEDYAAYIAAGKTCLTIQTPDKTLNNFVNHWLPRQIYYHGETNRLSTDPQTRNYLQDNMGVGYIKPDLARQTYLTALSQQAASGQMPDGILIHPAAELKYINQVPHTDHCVWLPICMKAYLDETNDYDLLKEEVAFADSTQKATVAEHLHLAMQWLFKNRDERGLSYIDQGDWCDPMNMVGPKGKGVSGWLSLGTAYALKVWAEVCQNAGDCQHAQQFDQAADAVNAQVNQHLWDGNWYARGITDDNVTFGIKGDPEGRIFLNPQGWALLSGAADADQSQAIIASVEKELESPYGVEMLGPPFSKMREDVGRVTQKFPGSAENGAVYNHAAAFYIFGLYQRGFSEKGFEVLRKMIPGPDETDLLQRGQLPVFIPNYYRGGYKQFPRTAGRSSQLFNTGTASWYYRCLIDGLFGLQGTKTGLRINPQLPTAWDSVKVTRHFRRATFEVTVRRIPELTKIEVEVDGKLLDGNIIQNIEPRTYRVTVRIG
ncbi:MAG: NdvB protein [Bacteroidota bacterium]